MKILTQEKLSPNISVDNSGYLICQNVVLARTGKQEYLHKELFVDGTDEIIEVDRPYNEVFDEKTIASFENKPFVDEHPDEDVTPSNNKKYQIGFVRDVRKGISDGQDVLVGTVVVTDEKAIEEIKAGKKQISCGYNCDIVKDDNGNYYQHNIVGNHIALCEEGRAGIARIKDSKSVKDTAMTITTQCYIFNGDKILIQDRVGPAWKGLAVPGGHVKSNEDVVQGCIREVKEETGLDVDNLELFGTSQYVCEEDGECIAMLYKTNSYSGVIESSEEGQISWMTINDVLLSNECAEGFKDLLTKAIGNRVKDSINDSSINFWEWYDNAPLTETLGVDAILEKYEENDKVYIDVVSSSDKSKIKNIVDKYCYRLEDNGRKVRVANGQIYYVRYNWYMSKSDAEYYAKHYDLKVIKDNVRIADTKVNDFDIEKVKQHNKAIQWLKENGLYDEYLAKDIYKKMTEYEYAKSKGMKDSIEDADNNNETVYTLEHKHPLTQEQLNKIRSILIVVSGKYTGNGSSTKVAIPNDKTTKFENEMSDGCTRQIKLKKDSIKDTLIPPTNECIKEVENAFTKLGWYIERQGKTMLDNIHYQIRTKAKVYDEDSLKIKFIELIKALDKIDDKYGCKPTCNVGLMKDGSLTAGVDIRKMYVKDSKVKKALDAIKKVQCITDEVLNIDEIDTKNYVVNHAGVWFAKPKNQKELFTNAYYSNNNGLTWNKATLEKKSSNNTGRTQEGKNFFRAHNPRTSIGRNVLTWYANNGIHNVDYSLEIDHVNGDYTDDKLVNLERVTPTENKRRRQLLKGGK